MHTEQHIVYSYYIEGVCHWSNGGLLEQLAPGVLFTTGPQLHCMPHVDIDQYNTPLIVHAHHTHTNKAEENWEV